MLKMVLIRLRQEKVIEDSEKKWQEEGEELVGFGYFRVIGLPFQISKNEIIKKLIEP